MPARFRELAVESVRAIKGLRVAGLDMIIRDVAAPASAENCAILEINHNPLLSMHHFPWIGQPRNVAAAVVDSLVAVRRPLAEPEADEDEALEGR